jgi:hypothetical protein
MVDEFAASRVLDVAFMTANVAQVFVTDERLNLPDIGIVETWCDLVGTTRRARP